jgi:ELWxxDGT repeat protein
MAQQQQVAVFDGVDASGQDGLWVTNGTAAGTYELTGIAGANAGGVHPYDLTAFNGEALFEGYDANGQYGLWVTNGTAAGTDELTGIAGANATSGYGLEPYDLTVFNGEALFNGYDANKHVGLWVTDGTAAGTYELTGIAGASGIFFSGLDPEYMTVFNGEVLFDGYDTNYNYGLWVTNGTVAGTHELTGIAGAYAGGLGPVDLTVFNGEVLFNGADDTHSGAGLWVTNGTAAGTYELTGIAGTDASGLGAEDITVFNGEALFNGMIKATNRACGSPTGRRRAHTS